mgnify:CR=1 FL=1
MLDAPTIVMVVLSLVVSLAMGALSCAHEYKRLWDKVYTWVLWLVSFISGIFCVMGLERLVNGDEPLIEDPSIHLAALYLASTIMTWAGIVVGENIYKRRRKAKVA